MTTSVGSGSIGDNSSQPIPSSVVGAAPMMGLDLVEFEQHFEALYIVYATYMG